MNRKSFLRAIGGATIGLPWLEMNAAKKAAVNKRLAWVYLPTGCIPNLFHPKEAGKDYELSPSLMPLKDLKADINVYSGLSTNAGKGNSGGHYDVAAWLTDAQKKVGAESAELVGYNGDEGDKVISCDQVAAQHLGRYTFLDSLQFCSTSQKNNNTPKYPNDFVEYQRYVTWKSATEYVVQDRDPYASYQRLFGGKGSSKSSYGQMESVLDLASYDLKKIMTNSGREDRHRLNQYFSSIRSLEKRIEMMKKNNTKVVVPSSYQKPDKAFASTLGDSWRTSNNYDELQQMYIDLFVLAFQMNRTKVITYQFAVEATRQNMSFMGVNNQHHALTHYTQSKKHQDDFLKTIQYHTGLYAKLLQRLKDLKEGDRTILENSLVMLGSGLGDANAHSGANVPCVVGGNGGGAVKTGRHVKFDPAKKLSVSGVHLGMLQAVEIPIRSFGLSSKSLI
jgi:hypothetical protein